MGWTYGNDWRTKNDIIEHCTQVSKSLTKLDHAVRGNNLWLLLQVNEKKFVVFNLRQKSLHPFLGETAILAVCATSAVRVSSQNSRFH